MIKLSSAVFAPSTRNGCVDAVTILYGHGGVELLLHQFYSRRLPVFLGGLGHSSYWMAGLLDAPLKLGHTAPPAFFNHPEVADAQSKLFGIAFRARAVTNQIQSIKERLKDDLYRFIEKIRIEVMGPENNLAIPMHVPLGLTMTDVIAETTVPVIAHHHDFAWEHERFTLNAVKDYLQTAFPPLLYKMEHVVINSMQQKELVRRLGIPSQIIPKVLDFETCWARAGCKSVAARERTMLPRSDRRFIGFS